MKQIIRREKREQMYPCGTRTSGQTTSLYVSVIPPRTRWSIPVRSVWDRNCTNRQRGHWAPPAKVA